MYTLTEMSFVREFPNKTCEGNDMRYVIREKNLGDWKGIELQIVDTKMEAVVARYNTLSNNYAYTECRKRLERLNTRVEQ
jgi:hypothetical protein